MDVNANQQTVAEPGIAARLVMPFAALLALLSASRLLSFGLGIGCFGAGRVQRASGPRSSGPQLHPSPS